MENRKKIVILSPQSWDHQFISKHHYAIAFAKNGDEVFFVNPESTHSKWKISDENKLGVRILDFKSPMPYFLKFKWNNLYRKITGNYLAKKINQQVGEIDLLIDFGMQRSVSTLKIFNAKRKIFFPVDDNEFLKIEKRGANSSYSVSTKIIEKYTKSNMKMDFMDHGLTDIFVEKARARLEKIQQHGPEIEVSNKIKLGYAGNLTIPFLDKTKFLESIKSVDSSIFEFHLMGSYDLQENNDRLFIEALKNLPNVTLYGKLDTNDYAELLFKMHGLMLCYKPDGKNYHGENSHKLKEYLSTGVKIIDLQNSHIDMSKINFNSKNIEEALKHSYRSKIELF